MTEYFFEDPYINAAVLIHQCSCGVAKFMYGVALTAETDLFEIFVDKRLNGLWTHSVELTADKQSIFVTNAVYGANFFILVDSVKTSLVKINASFFVAFTDYPESSVR